MFYASHIIYSPYFFLMDGILLKKSKTILLVSSGAKYRVFVINSFIDHLIVSLALWCQIVLYLIVFCL